MSKTITQAYNEIVDWNARFFGKEYEPIDKSVLQPILDLIPDEWGIDDGHWVEGYLNFCPECGCLDKHGTDNMASYPEAYYKTLCSSCGFLLAMVDNSPCCIWYQYKESNYKVEV